jgi:hypothetical protein
MLIEARYPLLGAVDPLQSYSSLAPYELERQVSVPFWNVGNVFLLGVLRRSSPWLLLRRRHIRQWVSQWHWSVLSCIWLLPIWLL